MSVGDHLRRDGRVFRVVGVGDEAVVLLRLTDAAGTRRATGEVRTVDRAAISAYEPAADPDAGRSLRAWFCDLAVGLVWEARLLLRR